MTSQVEMNKAGKTWTQFLITAAATIGYFTTCVHTGWPTPFIPKMLSTNDYPFEVSSEEVSYIVIISSVGNIVGGFVGGVLIDKIGRQKTVLSISLPQFLSFLSIALSYYAKIFLYVGRFVGGLSEGATFSLMQVYVAEIADPAIRGTLCMIFGIFTPLGFLFVNLVGSFVSIKWSAIGFMALPIVFAAAFFKMPESPYYLLMKGRKTEADQALQFLLQKRNVSQELAKLSSDVKRQMKEPGSYKELFMNKTNRKALLIAMGARTVQQLSGSPAFNQYLQVLLKEATTSLEPYMGSSIVYLFQLITVFTTSFFVDKFGRKPILLTSAIGCFVDLLLSTIYFFLKEHTSVDVSGLDLFPLIMMIVFNILYYMGLGVIVSIVVSEMFSASIKSKAACLTNIFYGGGMMFTVKYYQVTADNFGLTVPYFSFTVFCFLGALFLYFLLPETKGKTLEEIQQELRNDDRQ